MAVVKAQIHAGGRGKGTIAEIPGQRGVQIVRSREEAETAAGNLLGHRLVTIQTGPEGKTVHRVLVEEGCAIAKEFYLGAVIDRGAGGPVLIASPEGGVEIEHVAATMPDRIFTEPFDSYIGLRPHQIRKLAWRLGLPQAALPARPSNSCRRSAAYFWIAIAACWKSIRWLLTADDRLLALDAKMSFDDNALFRHRGAGRTARPGRRGTGRGPGGEKPDSATSNSTATSAASSTGRAWR